MDQLDLIFRAAIITIGVVLGAKILAPSLARVFSGLFGSAKKKQENIDLDILIENKKQMLRSGVLEKTDLGQRSHKKAKSSTTEEAYREKFREISQSGGEEGISDLKKTLALFDALQWGTSSELTARARKMSEKYGGNFESDDLVRVFRRLDKRETLLARTGGKLPDHDEILSLLETATWLEVLLSEAIIGKGELLKKTAQKYKFSLSALRRAVLSLALHAEGMHKDAIIEQLMEEQHSLEQPGQRMEILLHKMLLSPDKKFFASRSDLLKEIQHQATLFDSLAPLPPLKNKKDLDGARKILGVTAETPIEEIKKRYKKLAVLKHPDTLSAKGIPAKYTRIATENFAAMQEAYDIIQKSSK